MYLEGMLQCSDSFLVTIKMLMKYPFCSITFMTSKLLERLGSGVFTFLSPAFTAIFLSGLDIFADLLLLSWNVSVEDLPLWCSCLPLLPPKGDEYPSCFHLRVVLYPLRVHHMGLPLQGWSFLLPSNVGVIFFLTSFSKFEWTSAIRFLRSSSSFLWVVHFSREGTRLLSPSWLSSIMRPSSWLVACALRSLSGPWTEHTYGKLEYFPHHRYEEPSLVPSLFSKD